MGRKESMWKRLLPPTVLVLLVVWAQGALMEDVYRYGGDGDWPDPYLAATGLRDGATVFCDRSYTYTQVPEFLIGAAYVVTENDDKRKHPIDAQYEITVTPDAGRLYAFVWLDNRWAQPDPYGENPPSIPGWPVWLTIWGWRDTGADIGILEQAAPIRIRYNSVFYKPLEDDFFYTGPAQMDYSNFYGIAVGRIAPEPLTLLLLGVGALCLRTRGRATAANPDASRSAAVKMTQ